MVIFFFPQPVFFNSDRKAMSRYFLLKAFLIYNRAWDSKKFIHALPVLTFCEKKKPKKQSTVTGGVVVTSTEQCSS